MRPRSVLSCIAAAAALLAAAGSAGASAPTLLVGFSENLPEEIGSAATAPARDLGAGAMRITVGWSPGRTSLLDTDKVRLDRAKGAAGGLRLVLAVYGDTGASAPTDAAGRDAYCGYVRTVLARYSTIRDVVIWNEPNKRLFWNPQTDAPALYEALLARCWDVLHGAFSKVNVIGLPLSSTGNDNATSTSPGAFIRGVGDAYRASKRSKRILDTVGFHPYPLDSTERPWRKHIQSKVIALGDWNKLMRNLWLAFDGTGQPIPGDGGVSIWYLEAGFQTQVDPAHAGAYSGSENVAALPVDAGGEPDSPPPDETSPAPDQVTQIRDAIALAACQPDVGAFFNFLLFDEPALSGWQSGAYWADRTPKGSLEAFRSAIGAATSGGVDCGALKGGQPSGDFTPPPAPQNLRAAVPNPPQVELAWDAVSDDSGGAVSYRVYRNGALVATTADPAWTDASPTGTDAYSVRAIDAAANLGDASASVSPPAPGQPPAPPPAPTNLAATALSKPPQVSLTWAASTGAAGYRVYRDGAAIATASSTSYLDAGVTKKTKYAYAVTAVDSSGAESPPSATVSVKTAKK